MIFQTAPNIITVSGCELDSFPACSNLRFGPLAVLTAGETKLSQCWMAAGGWWDQMVPRLGPLAGQTSRPRGIWPAGRQDQSPNNKVTRLLYYMFWPSTSCLDEEASRQGSQASQASKQARKQSSNQAQQISRFFLFLKKKTSRAMLHPIWRCSRYVWCHGPSCTLSLGGFDGHALKRNLVPHLLAGYTEVFDPDKSMVHGPWSTVWDRGP